jgi:hypothetical protein
MPKGQSKYLASQGFAFTCSVKETKRYFITEKERENYKIRHQKTCSCVNAQGHECITNHIDGKSSVVVNDISKKFVDRKLYNVVHSSE